MGNFLMSPDNEPGAAEAQGNLAPDQEEQLKNIFQNSEFKPSTPGQLSLPSNASVPGQSAAQDPNTPDLVSTPQGQPQAQPSTYSAATASDALPDLMSGFKKAISLRLAGDINGYTQTLNDLLYTIHAPKAGAGTPKEPLFDGQTYEQKVGAYGALAKHVGEKFDEHYNEVFGENGQVARLKQATDSAQKWVRDAEAWAHYGISPDEVAGLQDKAQHGTDSERADANRQLMQAQQKAMDPGDPARLWNNMDQYHQAAFLIGNSMSQLGMALMHITGTTPMDQLNHLMDLDFQKQKLGYERRQGNLKNAYDAYSYAAQQTKDLAERENLAKIMMLTPLEIQAQSVNMAQAAQQIHEMKAARLQQATFLRFHAALELDTARLSAVGAHLGLMTKQLSTPVPTSEIDKITAGLRNVKIFQDVHDKATTAAPAIVGKFPFNTESAEYSDSVDKQSAEAAANTEGRGGGKDTFKAYQNMFSRGAFTSGAVKENTRAQAIQELEQIDDRLKALEAQHPFDQGLQSLRQTVTNAMREPWLKGEKSALVGKSGNEDVQLK